MNYKVLFLFALLTIMQVNAYYTETYKICPYNFNYDSIIFCSSPLEININYGDPSLDSAALYDSLIYFYVEDKYNLDIIRYYEKSENRYSEDIKYNKRHFKKKDSFDTSFFYICYDCFEQIRRDNMNVESVPNDINYKPYENLFIPCLDTTEESAIPNSYMDHVYSPYRMTSVVIVDPNYEYYLNSYDLYFNCKDYQLDVKLDSNMLFKTHTESRNNKVIYTNALMDSLQLIGKNMGAKGFWFKYGKQYLSKLYLNWSVEIPDDYDHTKIWLYSSMGVSVAAISEYLNSSGSIDERDSKNIPVMFDYPTDDTDHTMDEHHFEKTGCAIGYEKSFNKDTCMYIDVNYNYRPNSAIYKKPFVRPLSIFIQNNTVNISGLKMNSQYAIFDIQGRIVKKNFANSENLAIKLPNSGNYLLKIDNEIHKIIIK